MDADDLKEEKIRNLFSECLKLKLELLKVALTFISIWIGIETFIISNSFFDLNFKIIGGIVALFFIGWMAIYLKWKMYEINVHYFGI
jgi:hypothetical protein